MENTPKISSLLREVLSEQQGKKFATQAQIIQAKIQELRRVLSNLEID